MPLRVPSSRTGRWNAGETTAKGSSGPRSSSAPRPGRPLSRGSAVKAFEMNHGKWVARLLAFLAGCHLAGSALAARAASSASHRPASLVAGTDRVPVRQGKATDQAGATPRPGRTVVREPPPPTQNKRPGIPGAAGSFNPAAHLVRPPAESAGVDPWGGREPYPAETCNLRRVHSPSFLLHARRPPHSPRSTLAKNKKARGHLAFRSGRRDLNPRRPPWQGGTLPLSYSRGICVRGV